MKKILSIVTVIALIAMMSTGMCFAATYTNTTVNDVPVNLTAPSISDTEGGISFDVSEAITATVLDGKQTAVTYSTLKITNNASLGQLKLDSVSASSVEGWNLVANTTDFANLPTDANKFSMVTGEQDLSAGAKTYTDKLIAAGDSEEISFTGNTGTYKTAITATQIAKVVPTISIY